MQKFRWEWNEYITIFWITTKEHLPVLRMRKGTRLISFSIDDYRNQAEYFRTVEGTTDASFQERKADAVGTTLKATVVLRDTKEYRSGTWSHVQLTDYVGDYQKHWSNVHYFSSQMILF